MRFIVAHSELQPSRHRKLKMAVARINYYLNRGYRDIELHDTQTGRHTTISQVVTEVDMIKTLNTEGWRSE